MSRSSVLRNFPTETADAGSTVGTVLAAGCGGGGAGSSLATGARCTLVKMAMSWMCDRNSGSPTHTCGSTPAPGASGSVHVDLDVASVLSVALDRPSLSFGSTPAGETPTPLPENVTVSSNNGAGYSLAVARTAFKARAMTGFDRFSARTVAGQFENR